MLRNSTTSYGWLAIALHWLSAAAVVGLFALGWWMVDLTYYSEWYKTAPHIHKSVGLTLALLIVVRFVWRQRQTQPTPLGARWEQKAAHIAHMVMYLLLVCLFVSGYLISTADGRGIEVFNWFTVPSMGELFEYQEEKAGDVHEWLAYGLIGLAAVHALAALKHHFLNKDATLVRMLKPIDE